MAKMENNRRGVTSWLGSGRGDEYVELVLRAGELKVRPSLQKVFSRTNKRFSVILLLFSGYV